MLELLKDNQSEITFESYAKCSIEASLLVTAYDVDSPLLGSDGESGSPNLHSESLRVAQPGRYLPLGYVSVAVPGRTTSLGSGYNRTALAPQSSACFAC